LFGVGICLQHLRQCDEPVLRFLFHAPKERLTLLL
jgi:hypothetical protein